MFIRFISLTIRITSDLCLQVSSYSLVVRVADSGTPQLYSDAKVNIELRDVNDCPPRFSQDNYTAVVQVRKYCWEILNYYQYIDWGMKFLLNKCG